MKQIKKQLNFLGKVVMINLILYLIMLPYNFLRLMIAFLVKITLFIFGVKASLVPLDQGIILKGIISEVGIMQTFFEILTLASLTLALKKYNFTKTIVPVIIYYVILYSTAFYLFEKNIDATFITTFLKYQINYIIFPLLLIWYIFNKKSILEIFK